MTTRAEFVAKVRSYVGTAFHHQGRLPGVGLDCPGPLICAGWHFGIWPRTFNVTGYTDKPDGYALKAHCDQHLLPIEQDAMQAADVLLVSWQGGPPQHLGVLFDHPLGGLAMVHASSLHKCVLESRVKFGRAMRFVAAYAVPGVA